MKQHCECDACKDGMIHDSDCLAHNEPALPKGKCDCSPNQLYLTCQYCGEKDFDYIGLKMHYVNGDCYYYNKTPT